jgi:ribosomal protein L7/L12
MEDKLLDEVITDGINFLRSLTSYYGNDKGMEVWESMGDAIGKEVKGKIFFAMINGSHQNRLKFTCDQADKLGNNVQGIKTLRHYTGQGLKEAKDLWDDSKNGLVVVDCNNDQIRGLRADLRALGCKVI